MMYKIQNGIAPSYLTDILPPLVGQTNPYNLRNNIDITIPHCRLKLYQTSFFPATISSWNKLSLETRSSPSLNIFKNKIKHRNNPRSPHFSYGNRNTNIIYTQLRHGCSNLKADLYRVNLVPNSRCSCGHYFENVQHYFLYCPHYSDIRNVLLSEIENMGINPNIGTLLYGDHTLTTQHNIELVKIVYTFIQQSNRFS